MECLGFITIRLPKCLTIFIFLHFIKIIYVEITRLCWTFELQLMPMCFPSLLLNICLLIAAVEFRSFYNRYNVVHCLETIVRTQHVFCHKS